MDGFERRKLLVLGGTALSVGLGGCLGDSNSDEGNGDQPEDGGTWAPPYTEYLGVPEDDLVFGFIRPSGLGTLVDLLQGEDIEQRFPDDDLLRSPIRQLSIFWATQQIALNTIGLDALLDAEGASTASDVEWVLTSSHGVVLSGEIDTTEVNEILTTTAESSDTLGEPVTYEQSGSRGPYTLYEPAESEAGSETTGENADAGESSSEGRYTGESDPSGVVGVSEDSVILAGSGDRTALDVAAGEHPRAHEEFETLRWLLRTAGEGSVVFGIYERQDTGESDSDQGSGGGGGIFGSRQLSYSLTFEDATISMEMAVSFGNLPEDERELYRTALETELAAGEGEDIAPEADERSVDVTEQGVNISLTYEESLQERTDA